MQLTAIRVWQVDPPFLLQQPKLARETHANNDGSTKKQEQTIITHNWIIKAKANPTSRKLAMAAMCFQCMGGTVEELPDPGWKNLIATCTSMDCMMRPFRPYQKGLPDSENHDESN